MLRTLTYNMLAKILKRKYPQAFAKVRELKGSFWNQFGREIGALIWEDHPSLFVLFFGPSYLVFFKAAEKIA